MARKGHHLGGDPRPVFGYPRGVERSVGLVEQAHGGKDGNNQVVMGEIDIHRPIEWEGLGGRKQGTVGLQTVVRGGIREASDEFVDVSDALNDSQRNPISNE